MLAPSVPSLICTIFLNILPIRSSRKMTISWSKYFSLAGLLVKVAFGTLARMGSTKLSGMGGRGSVDDDHGSVGPGMKMNCECCDSVGNPAIASASALKPAK